MHVSIAQSRKALLPPRLLPMAESIPLSFNRSVAKSPSATRGAKDERLCEVARFQSLSREKPFCHSKRSRSIKREREFQSLSREKPFCHLHTGNPRDCWIKHVSIAQSRKALLPPLMEVTKWQRKRRCFNRSVAKSPSATWSSSYIVMIKWAVSIAQSRKALLPPGAINTGRTKV